ncbi:MAG: NAD(+)/NADH kinase [Clostridiales bacterium]|nr:NAD(+)/NADH kinase [Clostridiales bacterium]
MDIGVLVNEAKDENRVYTNLLCDIIRKYKLNVSIITDGDNCSIFDIIMSVGGDGTLIKTAKIGAKYNKPIVGVNLGKLGFLAKIDKDDIESYIKRISNGDYTLQKRKLINMNIIREGEKVVDDIALNDVVVSRKLVSRGIRINTYIDDMFINNYFADGVIVSTPLGSTAYSLSAGGPIVDARADVLVITPICPHSFSVRPYIAYCNSEIKITLDLKPNQHGVLIVDGSESCSVCQDDVVLIKESEKYATFINFGNENYFDKLTR